MVALERQGTCKATKNLFVKMKKVLIVVIVVRRYWDVVYDYRHQIFLILGLT